MNIGLAVDSNAMLEPLLITAVCSRQNRVRRKRHSGAVALPEEHLDRGSSVGADLAVDDRVVDAFARPRPRCPRSCSPARDSSPSRPQVARRAVARWRLTVLAHQNQRTG